MNLHALPIGVKPSEQSTYGPQLSNPPQPADLKNLDDMTGETLHSPNVTSWDVLTDAGFEVVMEICNAASTFLKGKYVIGVSRKQGQLSARAASMLVCSVLVMTFEHLRCIYHISVFYFMVLDWNLIITPPFNLRMNLY